MRGGVPSLGALQAFEATARLGTFSRAAEELALTHSAVHRQVAGLEASLGMPLFTRVRRRIVLTEAGAEYAARVRYHLEQLARETAGMRVRGAAGRSLHVAVLPTLATMWLIPRLGDFRRRHPDIAVSLSVRSQPFRFEDQPFDAAFYQASAMWPGTAGLALFDEGPVRPYCHPDLLAQARLADMVHLHMPSRPDLWSQWYAAQQLDMPLGVHAGPRYELFTMMLAAVKARLGAALIPAHFAAGALAAGELVPAAAGELLVPRTYYFGYPQAPEPAPAVLALRDWLATQAD